MFPPWGGIAPGERIWVLYESDIVATADVDRVTQLAECSANDLRELAVGYPIHEAEEYWRNLSRSGLFGRLSAVVVWTRDVRRREAPLKRLVRFQHNQHRSKSWVVVNQADDLAEVDAQPDAPPAEAVPGEAGAASLEERQLSNAVMGIGCLVLLVIALVVLVVVLLIWVF